MAPWSKRGVVLGLLVFFVPAFYYSVLRARMYMLCESDDAESIRKALRITPGNAACYARQAALQEQIGADQQSIEAALSRVVELNPYDSNAWIQLGLLAEARGDFASAERCLTEAARVDRTSHPRSVLANYYFRRGRTHEFWTWVREALRSARGNVDMTPLFRLCWAITQDLEEILSRAVPAERAEPLRQLLNFLLGLGQLKGTEAVVERIMRNVMPTDVPLLLAYCDRSLEAKRVESSTRVWNALIEAGLLPYQPLRPREGDILTNADFIVSPRSQGFDWRLPSAEGISITRDGDIRAIHITFYGNQPEHCEILWQYVPVAPSTRYRFRYEYRTSEETVWAGLRWRVVHLATPPVLLVESEVSAVADWTTKELVFATPAQAAPARLVLAYTREPGTVRIRGSVQFRRLTLKASPVDVPEPSGSEHSIPRGNHARRP